MSQDSLMEDTQLCLQISEQALESSSSAEGTITISLPGLPDGVNVTRSRDTFLVNDGQTLLERNEVRVSLYFTLQVSYESLHETEFALWMS